MNHAFKYLGVGCLNFTAYTLTYTAIKRNLKSQLEENVNEQKKCLSWHDVEDKAQGICSREIKQKEYELIRQLIDCNNSIDLHSNDILLWPVTTLIECFNLGAKLASLYVDASKKLQQWMIDEE